MRPRLRLLCLHSFRTSAAIFKEQVRPPVARRSLVLSELPSAPMLCVVKSAVSARINTPYGRWLNVQPHCPCSSGAAD